LSEHIRVDGADFRDGILSVHLKYQVPENLRPRKIAIDNYEEKTDVESIQGIDESD
jgi:molecular chaperone IbpA